MIDIHSHILFDIDDGAKDIKESLALCRDAAKNGLKVVVALPISTDIKTSTALYASATASYPSFVRNWIRRA